jgi:hypothetical protein
MAETNISVTDALRGQQEQLRRLIAQQNWLRGAPQATLAEVSAQISELKRLLNELEAEINQHLTSDQ